MAIKVGGTTVVNDSRQLSNIASVDATTVTTLSNAGLGGGGFDMTATGAISSGDLVALNTDGTVTTVGETDSDANPPTGGSETQAFTGTSKNFDTSYDTANDKMVCVFTSGGDARSFPATMSGTKGSETITVGSQTALLFKSTNEGPQVVYDSVGGKHIAAWSHYESDSDDGCHAVVLDASGSTITKGTQYDWLSGFRSDQFSMCYDADNQNIYISYQSDGGGTYIKAGSISGNTITFGSAVTLDSSKYNTSCAYDPDTNQIIVLVDGASKTRCLLLTVSGTTLTLQTELSANRLKHGSSDVSINNKFLMYEPHNNKIVASYSTGGNEIFVIAGTVTSNSVSWGSQFSVQSSITTDDVSSRGTKMTLRGDNTGKFVLAYQKGNNTVVIQPMTLSGTTLTKSVSSPRNETNTAGGDILFNPDIPNACFFTNKDTASANNLKVKVMQLTESSTNNSHFIGIAGEAIADGSSGEIKMLGSVDDQQSGLTPRTVYYAQPDGSLGTSNTDVKVGTAVTASAILITRPD